MVEHACMSVVQVCELFTFETTDFSLLAKHIKEEFNSKFGKNWQCLILIRGG
jgi:hypothetical protein